MNSAFVKTAPNGALPARRRLFCGMLALGMTLVAASAPYATTTDLDPLPVCPPEIRPDRSHFAPLDSAILPRLLRRNGYYPGPLFKALVVEIVEEPGDRFTYYPFDTGGSSQHRDDWWPASTVKIYAAIAALEKIRRLGFSPDATLTYHYEEEPLTRTMREIVQGAITPSNNFEYDRLVEFVGCDELNKSFLSQENGLADTVLLRGYSGRYRYEDSGRGSNRISPPITIEEGGRILELAARVSSADYDCPEQGNCTPLSNLAEAMRRVMMHEVIPRRERYSLGEAELELLRGALLAPRSRGLGLVEALSAAFHPRIIDYFHKPGYAAGWFSDNVFFQVRGTKTRWLVAMANRPGRDALDEAAAAVGKILASGQLTRARRARAE